MCKKQMVFKQQTYLGIIVVLIMIIVGLMVCIDVLLQNPKTIIEEVVVEKIVEVPVEVEKEVIVEKEIIVEVEIEPQYAYQVTSVEREMLARLLYREANTESMECQHAIVSVIINRWQSGMWGNTLTEVVYAPDQFEPANLIYCTEPTEQNYEAVDYVLKHGVTIPDYVMYFRADWGFSNVWDGYQEYKKIDDVCFGYMEKDKVVFEGET
jgi:spore germination cell wall hydrolase CwlJ-like protein